MKAKSAESAGITLDEMNRIIDGILINYPKLDSLTTDEIEKIKINFPDLNSDEIVENINVIDSFYTSLVRYDLVQELTKTESKSNNRAFRVSTSSNDYFGYDLNSSEFWYFVWHPALASPIKKATEKANSLTESNYPESGKWRDKADAFRHAIWNVLICKYIGEDKNEISDCTKRAEDFTTKHETGAENRITSYNVCYTKLLRNKHIKFISLTCTRLFYVRKQRKNRLFLFDFGTDVLCYV